MYQSVNDSPSAKPALQRVSQVLRNAVGTLSVGIALWASATHAAPIVADGNMADWGIQANGTAAGWQPTPNAGIIYTVEDQSNANGGYLSPGWGGQAYDAEALYVTWNKKAGQTYLYLGLITGHNPALTTQNGNYGAGDFAIDFGRNGTWDFGILTKNRTPALQAGKVVQTNNGNWSTGLWASPGVLASAQEPSPYVAHVTGGTAVGDAIVTWSQIAGAMGALGGNHWFYEVEIPVIAFGNLWQGDNPAQAFDVQWTMDCANDIITVDPPLNVPEPGAAALLLMGLGLFSVRRRRKAVRA